MSYVKAMNFYENFKSMFPAWHGFATPTIEEGENADY